MNTTAGKCSAGEEAVSKPMYLPWKVNGRSGDVCNTHDRHVAKFLNVDCAVHAVACVNALAGMDPGAVLDAVALLREIRDSDRWTVNQYEKNGPTWTGKDGHEYADMSEVVEGARERADKIDAALSRLAPRGDA